MFKRKSKIILIAFSCYLLTALILIVVVGYDRRPLTRSLLVEISHHKSPYNEFSSVDNLYEGIYVGVSILDSHKYREYQFDKILIGQNRILQILIPDIQDIGPNTTRISKKRNKPLAHFQKTTNYYIKRPVMEECKAINDKPKDRAFLYITDSGSSFSDIVYTPSVYFGSNAKVREKYPHIIAFSFWGSADPYIGYPSYSSDGSATWVKQFIPWENIKFLFSQRDISKINELVKKQKITMVLDVAMVPINFLIDLFFGDHAP